MYNDDNVFLKIINKEVDANVIYEDDKVLSFHDIYKRAKVHALIIPKMRFVSYNDFITQADDEYIVHFFKKVQYVAELLNIANTYKLITNHGSESGQVILHFHMHIMNGF